MVYRNFTVSELAGRIHARRARPRKCCVLIGAGASVTAGIGLAADFVQFIRTRHPHDYARAAKFCPGGREPNYAECMAQLDEADQAMIVREEIGKAKVNWAHIGIAMMEKAGIVDRILTTNFDPLAARACALLNRFPAIYDLAALKHDNRRKLQFKPGLVDGSAIYHLHGQHTGFILLNTAEKLRQQADRVKPVIQEAIQDRLVIVCGYSGSNDPLVERIASLGGFPYSLVWVTHNDEDPPESVRRALLNRFEDCVVIKNKPADEFFIELTRELNIDPPDLLYRQFDHYLSVLETIAPYSRPAGNPTDPISDLLSVAKSQLIKARESDSIVEIAGRFAKEDYQSIVSEFANGGRFRSLPKEGQELVAFAAKRMGDASCRAALQLLDGRQMPTDAAVTKLLNQSYADYRTSLKLRPGTWEALQNWSSALWQEARGLTGEDARKKLNEAKTKSEEALALHQDAPTLWYNYGRIYGSLSEVSVGAEKPRLRETACEHYGKALQLDERYHDAAFNLGLLRIEQAKAAPEGQRASAFSLAYQAFSHLSSIAPSNSRGPTGWGLALVSEAEMESFPKAGRLYRDAYSKFETAGRLEPLAERPKLHWGAALLFEADRRGPKLKHNRALAALEKLSQAFVINSRSSENLNLQGIAHMYAAEGSLPDDSRTHLLAAEEKLKLAEIISRGSGSYNLAALAARRRDLKEALRWIRRGFRARSILLKEELLADRDFHCFDDDPRFGRALRKLWS